MDLIDRYRGSLVGLACGDAVGTTVEFRPRGTFLPVEDMVGGGPFRLEAGQWTDDTSMALCLAESLIACGGFDAADQMSRYVNWWQRGHMSSTGECFDIGGTVAVALSRFLADGDPFAGSTDPWTAGNGSLMRLAPAVLYAHPDSQRVLMLSSESSRTTHAAPEALECCQLLGVATSRALSGAGIDEVLDLGDVPCSGAKVAAIARGEYLGKSREHIRGTGYCVACLEAALWCFAHTDSFAGAILAAANLGDDADTTAAVTGQIAGAFYGREGIPPEWCARVWIATEIEAMADRLLVLARNR
ncbi:MAG: ADP-ribosylglycohydrolase family protein [Thermoleophilia bacterium]